MTRPYSRILTLGLGVSFLTACGDSGGVTVGGTDTDGGTTNDTREPTTGDPPTTQTTPADETTDVPTGGTISGTGDTGDTGLTDPATEPGTDTGEVAPECGNGVVEGNEACDDGNQEPGDGCEPGCVASAECGNGEVEAGEVCDDGNTDPDDQCSADCQMATSPVVCGDGKQEGDEQCDDMNQEPGDGCEPDCTITPPECGNAMTEAGEECDDGNDVNGGANDFCKNDCTKFIPASCQAPAEYVICDTGINLADKNDKTNAHKAMGICNDAANNSVKISDFALTSNNNAAWQVAKGFGSYKTDGDMDPATPDELYYSPREGDTFLMVSSGVIAPPNADGVVVELPNSQLGNADNGNDGGNDLPPPFKFQVGSNNGAGGTPFQDCDGVNFQDCSDTLQAQWQKGNSNPNDKLWFTFKTKVPVGTFGYTFDFVFCSSEWPTYVNTQYNDLLIAYQVDPAADDPQADPPVDPYSGNVTFIPDPNNADKGLPLTITALDPYFKGPGFTGAEAPLLGTGFETHACTEWFTAKGGVQPGSDVTVGFFIADMGDTSLATVAILDNFRWDCEGCVPSEVDDCGIQDPQ